jgi:esterase/lipase superfamily enzyme
MGGWLTAEVLRQAKFRHDLEFNGKLGEVVLASPDIDIDVFRTQIMIGGDGKVQRRKVQLLQFDTDSVVVSHGLSAGEKVVTAGVNSLADGELVNPEMEVE